jgi:hypothetical protein
MIEVFLRRVLGIMESGTRSCWTRPVRVEYGYASGSDGESLNLI